MIQTEVGSDKSSEEIRLMENLRLKFCQRYIYQLNNLSVIIREIIFFYKSDMTKSLKQNEEIDLW